nr:SCO family protein [Gammaproteobacteria bacterium]
IFVSWFVLLGPEQLRPSDTSNRGTLIEPPQWISASGVQDVDGEAFGDTYFTGVWTLLYLREGACTDECRAALYRMRQSWKALNKDQPRVQRAFLRTVPPNAAESEFLTAEHPGLRIGRADAAWLNVLANESLLAGGIVVIIDPEGLALMYYQASDDARGIIKDMKRLLKLSKIG